MNFEAAKRLLRARHNMVLTRTPDQEFRVNFRGGLEESAYYTTDLDDAVNTAVAMRRRNPRGGER